MKLIVKFRPVNALPSIRFTKLMVKQILIATSADSGNKFATAMARNVPIILLDYAARSGKHYVEDYTGCRTSRDC
jgi:hypothetical protein